MRSLIKKGTRNFFKKLKVDDLRLDNNLPKLYYHIWLVPCFKYTSNLSDSSEHAKSRSCCRSLACSLAVKKTAIPFVSFI